MATFVQFEEIFQWTSKIESKPQEIKQPKTREHFMVHCLMEELLKYPRKFTEKENNFITSLSGQFFNDPELKLTHAQIDWLEAIWCK